MVALRGERTELMGAQICPGVIVKTEKVCLTLKARVERGCRGLVGLLRITEMG